ncbi:S8 family serine peptidase [Streptomyces sp. NPDC048484]|uniref:S8 family serine peptidase n=1 Tax=Streptomyces sp. NPDC048484 TaxID=3155146 RepID=UPI003449EA02
MGTTLAVLTIAPAGLAPNAVAEDVQSKQWYLEPMRAEEMWKVSTGKGIKVAVIDSGVNSSTPSLKGQVLKGVDLTDKPGGATDDYDGQGTTTAELIAGTGKGGGLRGLAPGAKIIPIRLPLLKHDEVPQVNDPLEKAIRAAADSDAQIIDISIGNEYPIGLDMAGQHGALEYAVKKGKLLIAGTGDNAKKGNEPQYPAAFLEVLGVASSDSNRRVSDLSQHGKHVDIAAPGAGLPRWCDANFKSYCDDGSGAVAAAAITSASAALIWSAHPDWTANQVTRVLFDTAGRKWPKDTVSTYLGNGGVRPRVALAKSTIDPGAADENPLTDGYPSKSDAKASPAASAPASSQPPKSSSGGGTAAAAASSNSSDDDTQLWVILGAVAAVAVIGGGTFAMLRRTRRSG